MSRGRAVAAGVASQFIVLDFLTETPRTLVSSAAGVLRLVLSAAFGLLCLWLANGRSSRVACAVVAGAYVVVQVSFYRYYHAAIDDQVLESLLETWSDVWPVLVRALPGVAALVAVASVVEYAALFACAGVFVVERSVVFGAALGTLAASVASPAWGAARRWLGPAAPVVRAAGLPFLPSTRRVMPNILLVVTESVRASDYCAAHEGSCPTAPEVDALLPDRIPLREMRAVASYTALSVAAIMTGRAPAAMGTNGAAAPGLFDFMKATRIEGRTPTVAYWSSQTASLFSRRDVRTIVDSFVTVDDLVGHAVGDEDEVIDQGVDRLLTAHMEAHVRDLPEPFALVLHFQGTHAPYFTDDARAPFQPMRHVVTWSGLDQLHNAYRNAIVEQDHSVARCLRAFLGAVGAAPYLILFTSDHGEAFGEHGAIHHGQNLYEEQIHVPAWVAAGNGALDPGELANLRAHENAVVTHLDLLPTLLDVAGVLDGYAMAPLRKSFLGRSLVAPHRSIAEPIPVTNCTSLFPCPLSTWGVFDESYAVNAQPWDAEFRCTTLAGLPLQDSLLPCVRLRAATRKWFPKKPNGASNR